MDFWRKWATRILVLFIVAIGVVALLHGCRTRDEQQPQPRPHEEKKEPPVRKYSTPFVTLLLSPVQVEAYQWKFDGSDGMTVAVEVGPLDYGRIPVPEKADLRVFLDDELASSWKVLEANGFQKIGEKREKIPVFELQEHSGWYMLQGLQQDSTYVFTFFLHPEKKALDRAKAMERVRDGFSTFQVFIMSRVEWFKRK